MSEQAIRAFVAALDDAQLARMYDDLRGTTKRGQRRRLKLSETIALAAVTDEREARSQSRPEGREGVVTVYDHDDRYLGCMGIETWHDALAAASVSDGREDGRDE